jgi:SAM-dependent methyltransferase
MTEHVKETWGSGEPYDRYVGRWSRMVAREFLAWLGIPPQQVWGDVGCGTGALTAGILAEAAPKLVFAIDQSEGFLRAAQDRMSDQRARFELADAAALPWPDAACDVTASGLVLNFVPDANAVVNEMVRVTRTHGTVAAYVWDYAGGMAMMQHFWDAAITVRPRDAAFNQAERFPLCQPEPLKKLFQDAGLTSLAVRAIEIPTVFRDFDDFWLPFLGGQGAAPTYLATLDSQTKAQIRDLLQARLATDANGSISLPARAWAIQGIV